MLDISLQKNGGRGREEEGISDVNRRAQKKQNMAVDRQAETIGNLRLAVQRGRCVARKDHNIAASRFSAAACHSFKDTAKGSSCSIKETEHGYRVAFLFICRLVLF